MAYIIHGLNYQEHIRNNKAKSTKVCWEIIVGGRLPPEFGESKITRFLKKAQLTLDF